jgi:hypothetical protein
VQFDPVAELASVEQVAAQHRHAGQALGVQFRPDRGKRIARVAEFSPRKPRSAPAPDTARVR